MWPKKAYYWHEKRTLKVSIPFTWELPPAREYLRQRGFEWDTAIVGGPAVELMPDYFENMPWVSVGHNEPGVMQRIYPLATRTTIGCIRKCQFCAIGSGQIEGTFHELKDWPDLPVICDNNLLASSRNHFDRVIDRLIVHGWADFNQGIDSRLLTDFHAQRFSEIKKPHIRLALDNLNYKDSWLNALNTLLKYGIKKSHISSYCLIAFDSGPQECWGRCEWVQSHGIKAFPMWYHELNQLQKNIVTPKQSQLGWDENGRKHIMGHYYKHRGQPLNPNA